MAKFSIIIPNYNHALYLKQRLDTVINQTFKDFEIILLDDASTDHSKDIIESYNPLLFSQIIYNAHNSGSPFKQWAKGISLAQGEYIWIAESDDYCTLIFLEEVNFAINLYPEAALLYSETTFLKPFDVADILEKTNEGVDYLEKNELFLNKILNGLKINNASAVVFKKELVLPFLETLVKYKKHGDYYLWTELTYNNTAVSIKRHLNFCRILETSVTRASLFKTQISFEEHIAIFKNLNYKIKDFSWVLRKTFYNHWSVGLSQMIKNLENKYFLNHLFILKKTGVLHPYFWAKIARNIFS